MCRKHVVQGCCLICFGLGLAAGFSLESRLVCTVFAGALLLLGLMRLKAQS